MSDAAFDPALLDALARCFVEAAVRQLLATGAEKATTETNPLSGLEIPPTCTTRGPALLTASHPDASRVAPVLDARGSGRLPSDVIPETGEAHGR